MKMKDSILMFFLIIQLLLISSCNKSENKNTSENGKVGFIIDTAKLKGQGWVIKKPTNSDSLLRQFNEARKDGDSKKMIELSKQLYAIQLNPQILITISQEFEKLQIPDSARKYRNYAMYDYEGLLKMRFCEQPFSILSYLNLLCKEKKYNDFNKVYQKAINCNWEAERSQYALKQLKRDCEIAQQ